MFEARYEDQDIVQVKSRFKGPFEVTFRSCSKSDFEGTFRSNIVNFLIVKLYCEPAAGAEPGGRWRLRWSERIYYDRER